MANNGITIDIRAITDAFERAMSKVVQTMGKVHGSMKAVSDFSKKILIGGGAGLGLITKLAAEDEAAQSRLMAALTASGQSATIWGSELDNAAKRLQALTVIDDEAAKGLFVFATNLNVAAGQVEKVTQLSVGLGKAIGMDANSAIKAMVMAMNGQFTMLSRYIPALRENISETEKLAVVTKLAERGFEQAKAETLTFGGTLTQLKNMLGDVGEKLGGAVLPQLRGYAEMIKAAIPDLDRWISMNSNWAISWGKLIGISAALTVGLNAVLGVILKLTAVAGGIGVAFVAAALAIGSVAVQISKIKDGFGADNGTSAIQKYGIELGKAAKGWDELAKAKAKGDTVEGIESQIKAIDSLIQSERERANSFDDNMIFGGIIDNSNVTEGKAGAANNIDKLIKQRDALVGRGKGLMGERDAKKIIDEEEQNTQNEIAKSIDKIREKAETVGLTEREIVQYNLTLKNATEGEKTLADSMQMSIDKYEETQTVIQRTNALQADSRKQAADMVNDLRNQIDLLSGATTEDAIKLFDLQQLDDTEAGLQRIATLKNLIAERDRQTMESNFQKAVNARHNEAESLKDNLKTAQEIFDEETARVGMLERAGELDADFAARARKQAADKLANTAGGFQARFESGVDMFRRIQESTATPGKDPQTRIANATEKVANTSLENLKETRTTNKLITKLTDNQNAGGVGVFGE